MALAVLFSHTWPVLYGVEDTEPLKRIFGVTFGHVAVNVFFVISGFLVSRSLWFNQNILIFARNRVLRIYPALWICLVVMTLLSLFISTIPMDVFFTNRSFYAYMFRHGSLLNKEMNPVIEGLFTYNPIPFANASLWTLPREMMMYATLPIVFATDFMKKNKVFLVLFVAINIACFWLNHKASARFVSYFYWGVFFAKFAGQVPLNRYLAIGSAIIFMVLLRLQYHILLAPFLAYTTLFVAFTPFGLPVWFSQKTDISYGTYLYAFPVQQTVFLLGLTRFGLHLLVSVVVTLFLATLSWHFIEKPALALKKGWPQKRTSLRNTL